METVLVNALGALAGVAIGLLLAGAAYRQSRPAEVPVRSDEEKPRRRRRRKV